VRERCGIPGTSVRTAWLCRDKPSMKEALRAAGIPCAQSASVASADEALEFAARVGYPLILKPRSGAGAAGTRRVDDDTALRAALPAYGLGAARDESRSIAIEEFIEGHEGFLDTLSVDGEVRHEFISHYYPNVLEAMRERWISPQIVATNRIDAAGYAELRDMARQVIRALGIGSSATHMEWFFGPKGLKFSEIGCRPPGVGQWDVYAAANEFDVYREWALAVTGQRSEHAPSRRYAGGMIALRPTQDGRIVRYEGVERIAREHGEWVVAAHLPPAGTPTQPVEAGYMANAWMRLRHPDYDTLRAILNQIGEAVRVIAA
jgi:formate-dependent phosphoribosylglycinamide formyltransferase (GAR transformylase)